MFSYNHMIHTIPSRLVRTFTLALGLAFSTNGQGQDLLGLVPLTPDGSPARGCRVHSFRPYNDEGLDLASQFVGLLIERALVGPNAYHVALKCEGTSIMGRVVIGRQSRKVLVSGPSQLVHESFGPNQIPRLKIMVRTDTPNDSMFVLMVPATRADESMLVEVSTDGVSLVPNPMPGKYLFAILSEHGVRCSGLMTIARVDKTITVRPGIGDHTHCRAETAE